MGRKKEYATGYLCLCRGIFNIMTNADWSILEKVRKGCNLIKIGAKNTEGGCFNGYLRIFIFMFLFH